jgi:hypothetical protein
MGYNYLSLCCVPIGTHSVTSENHRTAPVACTVLFISHPFGMICISLTFMYAALTIAVSRSSVLG